MLAGWVPLAAAQRGVTLSQFRPAVDADSFLTVQSSRTPGHGRFGFQWVADWAVDPLSVGAADQVVVAHQLTARAQFQVGVGDRVALAVDAPLVLHQSGNGALIGDGRGEIPGSAAGNPTLLTRVRLVGELPEGDRLPELLGVALQFGLAPPVGDRQSFAADSDWVASAQVVADYHILGAGLGASVGARFRLDDTKEAVSDVRVQHALDVGIGIKVPFFVVPDWYGLLDFRWVADLSGEFGFSGPTNTVEGNLGVRYRPSDFAVTFAVGTELAPGFGSPALRSTLAIAWSPKVADADGDGTPDEQDECVFLAEDRDGFADDDGCPDPDNDGDLVTDDVDRCPNEAAEEFRDEDEDGCTDPPE